MEHIRDVNGLPVIGRQYRVPCVWARFYSQPLLVPIIGPWHEDVALEFPHEHFHIDWRFVKDWQWFRVGHSIGSPAALGQVITAPEGEVFECRRKCIRQMPEFPMFRSDGAPTQQARRIHRACQGMRLKPGCMVCPHKGMPLNGLPVDGEGRVVCPGHGMRWDLATGEMVARIGL
jgi:hypothetical protein